jgi:hypothetical protein
MKKPQKVNTPSDTKQQPKVNKPSDSKQQPMSNGQQTFWFKTTTKVNTPSDKKQQPKVNKPSDTKQHPKVTDLLIQNNNKPCQCVPGLACSRWPACRRVPSSATCSALSTKRT